jgi:uroporphyrinogen-III synthase
MASVVKTARDASSLANAIIGDKVRELLFFCGTLRREELSIQLAESGILLVELPVYRTTLTPQVTGKNYAGILFFSPSAVESFFSLNKVLDETILFAIGPTTAAAIRKFSANKIVTGELPGKELLLQQSIRYFLAGNHRKA